MLADVFQAADAYDRHIGRYSVWAQAGLEHVAVTPALVKATYGGFEDLWAPFERGVGPAGAWAVSLGPEPRAALKAAFHERLALPGGPFTLSARAWLIRDTGDR